MLDHGITDYDKLVDCTKTAGQTFDVLSIRIKQLESRMADKAQLKMHIINYSKTRNIYKEYNKSRNKEKYRAAHADEIEKHEAAKAAFDALGGKPIPKVSQLSEEYTMLLAEKRDCYEKYKIARKDMIEYQKAKQNIDKILGFEPLKQENQKDMQR